MATKKARKQSRRRKSKIDLAQYARLRTLLDSLQIGALRFYLDTHSAAERTERFEKVQSALMPIIREVWGRGEALTDCPEGYMDCGGVCVPYQCIGGQN